MKTLLALLLLSGSIWSASKEKAKASKTPKNMVRVSPDGLGWDSTTLTYDVVSTGEEVEYTNSELKINYTRLVSKQVQLGFDLTREVEETDYATTNSSDEESETFYLGLKITYNFSKDIQNSWYLGGGFESSLTESKTGTSSESKVGADGYFIGGGKRWSLKNFGLPNISYSPSLTYGFGEWTKDAENLLDDYEGLNLRIIAFDIFW